jgi:hypothetical protein
MGVMVAGMVNQRNGTGKERGKPASRAADRKARLAESLRDNLKKRKEQARARERQGGSEAEPSTGEDT